MMRRLLLLFGLLAGGLAWSASAEAGTCPLPYNLINGVIYDATQVMADLNALAGCITGGGGLPACSSSAAGLVPATGGGTTKFLRADCTFAAPPGGGGGLTLCPNVNTAATDGQDLVWEAAGPYWCNDQRVIGAPGAASSSGATTTIAGGLGGTSGGAGGPVNVMGGAGDNPGGGNGGDLNLIGGAAGTGGGNDGNVNISTTSTATTGAPGYISITVGDAGVGSHQDGAPLTMTTGLGDTGLTGGEIDISTTIGQGNTGTSGAIKIVTGPVGFSPLIPSSSNILISTGQVTSDTDSDGSITIETNGGNGSAGDGAGGAMTLQASNGTWNGNSAFGTLQFGTHLKTDAYFYGGTADGGDANWVGFLDWISRNLATYSGDAIIQGAPIGGDSSTAATLHAGDVWIAGGESEVYNGTAVPAVRTGNVVIAGGYNYNHKYSTGLIIEKTASADQSYAFDSGGDSSIVLQNQVGSLVLDGVSTTYAVTFPNNPQDGQQFKLMTATALSGGLTCTPPASETIKACPTTPAANTGFGWQYHLANTTWYRMY